MHRITLKIAGMTLRVGLCASSLLALPAFAHHTTSMFDRTKEVTLEGTVKEYAWTNPHVTLSVLVDAKDGTPQQVWTAETTSPGNLTRMGWTKRTFTPGDRVKLVVYPLRSGDPGGSFARATLVDSGKVVSASPKDVDADLKEGK